MVDEGTRKSLQSIPLLQTRASPRDKDLWVQRLKEELMALIKVTYDSCIHASLTHLWLFAVCSKQQGQRQ